jgi:hypothetical protein
MRCNIVRALRHIWTLQSETKLGGRLRRLLSAFVFVGAGVLPDNAFGITYGATAFSGSLTASAPTMSGRIFRNSVASGCGALKAYPGDSDVGTNFRFASTTMTWTGATGCVGFRYTGGTCGTAASLSIYSGIFDPNNRSTN